MKAEDKFIISTARTEIEEEVVLELLAQKLDWDYVVRAAALNRLDGLIFHSLDRLDVFEKLPEAIRKKFEERYRLTVVSTRIYLAVAEKLLADFARRELEVLLLRGLALGATVYGNSYLRPFSDLDLLIRKDDFGAARQIFREHGFAPPAGLLPERYFLKYHLHLQLRQKERGVVAEIHWLLDHPYSLYTVDYSRLFRERKEAEFSGVKLPVLNPDDRLLALCLHFFKHCPFLPGLIGEDDFLRLLLRGKWLIWLLDIYETLVSGSDELNWERIRGKANDWNLERQLAFCLAAVKRVYKLSLPSSAEYRSLPVHMKYPEKNIYQLQLRHLRGEGNPARAGRFLFALRPDAVFRPLRILDLLKSFLPPPAYLRKRYRLPSALLAAAYVWHLIKQVCHSLSNLGAFAYYSALSKF